MKNDHGSVISASRRVDFFPPISSPATMFQRRKKKSARELYFLSPQNHDLILSNPPVTPWEDPPEFYRTFLGTPEDQKNDGDLSTTWPFLRQLGPRCVFRGMRKKPRDEEGPDDSNKLHRSKDEGASKSTFNERFLEPECIGLLSQHHGEQPSPRYTLDLEHLHSTHVRKYLGSAAHIPDAPGNTRRDVSMRRMSESRSAKSDDGFPDDIRKHRVTQIRESSNAKRVPHGNNSKVKPDNSKKRSNRYLIREHVVRFEESPLPEKLQNLNLAIPDPSANAEMHTLTWNDIVQAPVNKAYMRVRGEDARVKGDDARKTNDSKRVEKKSNAQVSFRLSKTNAGQGLSCTGTELKMRGGPNINDHDLTSSRWIDDVRKAQTSFDGESISR